MQSPPENHNRGPQARESDLKNPSRFDTLGALALNCLDDAIAVIDPANRIVQANLAFHAMFGLKPEHAVNRDLASLLHPAADQARTCPITAARHAGLDTRLTLEAGHSANPTGFPLQVTVRMIRDQRDDLSGLGGEAIKGAAILFHNITESRAMERRMNFLTTHDCLTGLINRYEFERRLEEAIDSAQFFNIEHVLCYMDIDQFKVINDTCSHKAGDELLRQLGAILLRAIRREDALARLGGDEFGLLLRQCPLEQANRVINKIRSAVDAFRFVWKDRIFAVTFSIGLLAISKDTQSRESALSAADSSCYMAKEGGRNRVHVYQDDDAELIQRHGEMQWVSRVHEALAEDRLVLRNQKIVKTNDDGRPGDCCEILVSMRDREGQLVPPGAFLPAAERFNLMPAIDRWVLRATLKWLTDNQDRLDNLDMCTINLSGLTLCDRNFQQYVLDEMRGRGIPPEKICFEITETAVIASLSTATSFINTMRQQGYRFALDDFGSGLSSFGYLKDLPVDYLKIDGCFVRDLDTNPVHQAIVAAINQIGHVMRLKTIAEHVENDTVLAMLKIIGVDYVQGFGISPPELIPRA